MRVLIAPDSFGSTLTAVEAAEAMRDGWLAGAPGDEVVLAPLSDGGPGFVDVLASALGGERVTLTVEDPLARAVEATYLRVGDTAYVESAQACGLHLLTTEERDPLRATTYGVGQLIKHALDAGAARVVVGLGGSATNDGGAGMLAALGVRRDWMPRGSASRPAALPLLDVDHLVVDLHPRLAEVELRRRHRRHQPAARLQGRQRGVRAAEGRVAGRDPAPRPRPDPLGRRARSATSPAAVDVRGLEGAGAAGGMGAALLALGATRVSGIGLVRDALGLAELVASVGLVVTGEGTYDWQSRDGKVISGVTQLAIEHGLPCVLIAGQVVVGRRQTSSSGLDGAYALDEAAGSVQEAMDRAALLGCARSPRRLPANGLSDAAACENGAQECSRTRPGWPRTDALNDLDPAGAADMTLQDESSTQELTTATSVVLSDVAAAKVKSLLEQEGRTDLALRVAVQPGGCSGLRYQLFFDDRSLDGDVVTDFGGVNVVVDRMSNPYLLGASVDFVDTIEKQGFTIDNPNATGGCACGESFS